MAGGLFNFVHVFTFTNLFVLSIKMVLQSIICVLCVFVLLLLGRPLSGFAVKHLPEGMLWTGFRLLPSVFWLPGCGSRLMVYEGFAETSAPTS